MSGDDLRSAQDQRSGITHTSRPGRNLFQVNIPGYTFAVTSASQMAPEVTMRPPKSSLYPDIVGVADANTVDAELAEAGETGS